MVDNIWSEFAESYDRVIPNLVCYQAMLVKILDRTKDAKSIIDAGCGTGIVGQAMVHRGQRVFGFDNNPGMLARALDKAAALSPGTRALWTLGDGDVMRFPADTPEDADALVLNNVLFYVPDPDRAIEESARHLAPGGVLVATGPRHRPDGEKVFRAELAEWARRGQDVVAFQAEIAHHVACMRRLTQGREEMVTFFEPRELADRLLAAGFREVLATEAEDYYGENFFVAVRK
jgi:ubiquinone/menaquinone biosynthesis C-methylase UbiE